MTTPIQTLFGFPHLQLSVEVSSGKQAAAAQRSQALCRGGNGLADEEEE